MAILDQNRSLSTSAQAIIDYPPEHAKARLSATPTLRLEYRLMSAPTLTASKSDADVRGLTEYIDAANAELGPVPAEVIAQVRADIAAADARIGFSR